MTPETDCPSHIEARERLQAEVAAIPDDVSADTLWLIALDARDWRTLFATPTQEGVGREEVGVEHAAATLYDRFWERNGWANPVPFSMAPAAIRHMWRCITLDALSLLPAPKLGEGAATVQFVTSPQFEVVRRYAVICDMGGHKNVRCVVSLDERDPYSTADLADATRIAAETRDAGTANVRLIDACSGETLG